MNLYDVMKDPIGLSTAVTKKCEMFVDLIEDLRENREHYALERFLGLCIRYNRLYFDVERRSRKWSGPY